MNIDPALLRKLLDALIHATSCVENNYYPARGTKDWNMLIVELDRMLAEAAVAEAKEPTNG